MKRLKSQRQGEAVLLSARAQSLLLCLCLGMVAGRNSVGSLDAVSLGRVDRLCRFCVRTHYALVANHDPAGAGRRLGNRLVSYGMVALVRSSPEA